MIFYKVNLIAPVEYAAAADQFGAAMAQHSGQAFGLVKPCGTGETITHIGATPSALPLGFIAFMASVAVTGQMPETELFDETQLAQAAAILPTISVYCEPQMWIDLEAATGITLAQVVAGGLDVYAPEVDGELVPWASQRAAWEELLSHKSLADLTPVGDV